MGFRRLIPGPLLDAGVRTIIRTFALVYESGVDGTKTTEKTTYFGVKALKNPLDLWIYQEIIVRTRPDVIIECGVSHGGSTLYLAHLCDQLGHGRVIGCDITHARVHPSVVAHPRISLILGSSTDASVHEAIAEQCREHRTMIILDDDHSEQHVLDELRLYGGLVSPGCYLICEDTIIRPVPGDGGPSKAIERYLTEERGWRIDHECEKLLVSNNPSGYLLRLPDADRYSTPREEARASQGIGSFA